MTCKKAIAPGGYGFFPTLLSDQRSTINDQRSTIHELTMKKPLTCFCLLFVATTACTQSWQWSVRGGGFSDGSNVTPEESVMDMATDPHGNVYIIGRIEASGNPTLGNALLTTYGNRDVLIASYTCSGALRWKKVIGGISNDYPVAVRADSSGHVYVTGTNTTVNTHNVHFDSDSTQAAGNYKSLYLVQYDTSGVFRWLRQPTPDTVPAASNPVKFYSYDLEVTPSGDVFMLSYLSPGLLSGDGGNVITQTGNYLLRYNVNGDLVSIIRLDMDGRPSFTSIRINRTKTGKFLVSGSLYVFGSGTNYLYMGGQQVTHGAFIGCFDPQGQFLWKRENELTGGGFLYRAALDASGNILLAGQTAGSGDSFNGTAITNTIGPSSIPFIVKLDSNGSNLWLKNASSNAASFAGAVVLNGNKAYLLGDYPRRLLWDSYTLTNPVNAGYTSFVAQFDTTTGNVTGVDSLDTDFGFSNYTAAMVADTRGNLYIGGRFEDQLYIGATTLQSYGGSSDLFLAKYGSAGCAALPVSLLSFTASLQVGSVLCNWQTTAEQNTSHFVLEKSTGGASFYPLANITAAGNSNALLHYRYNDAAVQPATGSKLYYRLRIVDKDGSFTYSNVAVITLAAIDQLSCSPNPVFDKATFTYSFASFAATAINTLELFSINGSRIAVYPLQQKGTMQLDMSAKPPGIYLVVLKQNGSIVKKRKIIVSR
jgi:hypothetical protein